MKLVKDNIPLIEELADSGDLIYEKLGIVQHLRVGTNYLERIKEGKEELVLKISLI